MLPRTIRALVGLALLAAGARSVAAEPNAPPAASPSPFPLAEVAIKSDAVALDVSRVERQLVLPDVEAIAAALPEAERDVRERTQATERLLAGSPTLRDVKDAAERWEGLESGLEAWRVTLTSRVAELDRELAALDEQRAVWRATRAAARAESAPPVLLERIDHALAAIRALREDIEERRKQLWVLQAGIAVQRAAAREPLERLRTHREDHIEILLVPDSVPLWAAAPAGGIGVALRAIAAATRIELVGVLAYVSTRLPGLFLQICVFVALWIALRRARGRAQKWIAEDATLARAARVFDVPAASALLIALFASRWLFPDAPLLGRDVVGLLMLFPALRVLRRLGDPPLAPALWALALFYVADAACRMLAPEPFLEQLVFLVEMLGAAAFLVWLLRSDRVRSLWPAGSVWAIPAERAARVLVVLFTVSGIAGALGFMHLARYLQEVLVDSSFAAVVLFGSLQVVEGLWAAGLRVRPLRLLQAIEHHRTLVQRRGERFFAWLAVAVWAVVALRGAGLFEPTMGLIRRGLAAQLTVGTLALSLGALAAFALTVWASFAVSRFVRFVLAEDVYPHLRLGRGLPYAVSSLVHYLILFVGFLFAVAASGVDLSRFALLAGAFGVGIGFGLQNVVNNFVSGLILLFERPIKVGDTVQLAQVNGEVRHIGIRSSTVRTFDGAEVIVPNSEFVSSAVTNWTLSDRTRRIDLPIGVAYGSDPERVLALLRAVANAHPLVSEHPAPLALFTGFGDSALNFELRVWTDHFDQWATTRSELGIAVHRALGEAGIDVPFPQRDIRLSGDAPVAVRVVSDAER